MAMHILSRVRNFYHDTFRGLLVFLEGMEERACHGQKKALVLHVAKKQF